MTRRLPPEDDSHFSAWQREIGPMRELPTEDESISPPLVAAIVLLVGSAAVLVALSWAALRLAVDLGVWSTTAVVLLTIGSGMVILGGAGYAASRWVSRRGPDQ